MNRPPAPANQMAAEDWSGAMGERWLANLATFEGMIGPVGEALMTHSAFAEGERVIDVGCGGGGTTIEIARRVGPSGAVFGLDISQPLLDAATRRARDANVHNAQFHCADAATFRIDGPPFDRLFSRFGLMFFAQPMEAFKNLHGLLRRGARADFSVWAPAAENAWVAQVMGILGRHIELPAPVPHAPGPFAFDDPVYLRGILEQAGFESTHIDMWQGSQFVGGAGASPETAAEFVLGAMHFGELLDEAIPTARDAVRADLIELFGRHRISGGIAMGAKAFLVSARA